MNKIKQLRLDNNLLQSDLADILNVGQGTISNWENGRTEPDQESLKLIAQHFNVSLDYLLGFSDDKNSVPVLDFEQKQEEPTQNELDSLTDLQKEIIALMGNMSQESQAELLKQAQYQIWLELQNKD